MWESILILLQPSLLSLLNKPNLSLVHTCSYKISQELGFPIGSTPVSASCGVRLEVFVDFTCPFSQRLFERLVKDVKPHYNHKVEIIMQPMPQPWHPSSCMVHETFHAACIASPFKRAELLITTMENALPTFGDVHTLEMTRKELHEKLASIYERNCGVEKQAVLRNLVLDTSDGQINGGNNATRLLKFYTKAHRQLGVHVTPSTRVNNIMVETSSGWTLTEWIAFLDPLIDSEKI